jgi:hypothetical protein
MLEQAHKKSIKTSINLSQNILPNSGLNRTEFDKAIEGNGYDVEIEKALMCPCSDSVTGQGKPSCKNCNGIGWIFINKTSTRALIQHINQLQKKENWTNEDKGTAQISTSSSLRIGFMDRVVIKDLETIFSQNVYCLERESENTFVGFFTYFPIEIEEAFCLKNLTEPLIFLKKGIDFEVEENRLLIINQDLFQFKTSEDFSDSYITISIRYFHNPTYHITDINREVVKSRIHKCGEQQFVSEQLPTLSTGKKAQYILDQPNLLGKSVFDNSTP